MDILKDVKGNTLDPSQTDDIMTAKMIIDATKPARRPYAARLRVPEAALRALDPRAFIPEETWHHLTEGGEVRKAP